MENDSQSVALQEEDFGVFWKYIEDPEITDVDYNGHRLLVTNIYGERSTVEEQLPAEFIDKFCQRVADSVNGNFTASDPILEAQTESLRISIVHEVIAASGRSICIRHVAEKLRFENVEQAITERFASKEIMSLILNCVRVNMNIAICGSPGVGKTETARFISHFIPNDQRVITIEDSPEWHYREINPGHDCVEMKVGAAGKDYSDLLKACLRQHPKWVMLSEARSREVIDLVENMTSGVSGITTLHTNDVRKIPLRMIQMAGSAQDAERMEYNIYECLDVGILVRMKGRRRYIDQLCFFTRENEENKSTMIVVNGKSIGTELPEEIQYKFNMENISNVFSCPEFEGEVNRI